MSDIVHVAAGVIYNEDGKVLLARRPDHLHQGGLWEFPGGKLEPGESAQQALSREIHEELGITIGACEPLIRIPYRYPDRNVLLDIWQVNAFTGEPHGREGQPLCWVAPERLDDYAFPAANQPIVTAVQLPSTCMITPPPESDEQWLAALKKGLHHGVKLVQLRLKDQSPDRVDSLTRKALALCHPRGCRVLLNAEAKRFAHLPVDGFHLPANALSLYSARPVSRDRWLSAAIHNRAELAAAAKLDVDFGFAAPVQATSTHPEAEPLGWSGFAELADAAPFPLYALGGMQRSDIVVARQHGGQGIAGIRLFSEVD